MPGAEPEGERTDQDAEDVLMAAAEQNGYIADHSAAAARSAIRSGHCPISATAARLPARRTMGLVHRKN